MIRIVVPDSHGSSIDPRARDAFLTDLSRLDVDELVLLGDHVDVSGLFSAHAPKAVEDLEYTYSQDVAAANEFLDEIQRRAPKARMHYLEGNHEWHVERWAVNLPALRRTLDANAIVEALAPHSVLKLKDRGIKFYRYLQRYHGLAAPNTIKLGKCYFTHGFKANKHATASHVEICAGNVVHGHTHRAQAYVVRTMTDEAIGGWCPGTLAKLQPTYLHSSPSNWTHGYEIQFVEPSGRFLHINVPIVRGSSLLGPLLKEIA